MTHHEPRTWLSADGFVSELRARGGGFSWEVFSCGRVRNADRVGAVFGRWRRGCGRVGALGGDEWVHDISLGGRHGEHQAL